MRRIIPIMIACLCLAACNRVMFSPNQAFEQLGEARTAAEEASAFTYIWEHAAELGFSAHAENGELLPVSSQDFPARLHTIELRVNGEAYTHTLIAAENVYILMME